MPECKVAELIGFGSKIRAAILPSVFADEDRFPVHRPCLGTIGTTCRNFVLLADHTRIGLMDGDVIVDADLAAGIVSDRRVERPAVAVEDMDKLNFVIVRVVDLLSLVTSSDNPAAVGKVQKPLFIPPIAAIRMYLQFKKAGITGVVGQPASGLRRPAPLCCA